MQERIRATACPPGTTLEWSPPPRAYPTLLLERTRSLTGKAIWSMLDPESKGAVYHTELRGFFLAIMADRPREEEAEAQAACRVREFRARFGL